jgi:hypothetical protein
MFDGLITMRPQGALKSEACYARQLLQKLNYMHGQQMARGSSGLTRLTDAT